MNLIDYFSERKTALETEIDLISKKLDQMPPGNLSVYPVTINGKTYTQWQWKLDGSIDGASINRWRKSMNLPADDISQKHASERIYLRKQNRPFAMLLAKKKYLKRMKRDKENELKCANYYIRHRSSQRHLELLSPDSPYSELLLDKELLDWENAEYPKSEEYPEDLTVKAPKGEFVRSKSEAMIAQVLYDNHIPYRYENIHIIDGQEIATDFTILHPKTRKIMLWEHFGKVDDHKYRCNMLRKLNHYFRDGYLPDRDIIFTFEDSKTPLNFLDIQETVRKHFT